MPKIIKFPHINRRLFSKILPPHLVQNECLTASGNNHKLSPMTMQPGKAGLNAAQSTGTTLNNKCVIAEHKNCPMLLASMLGCGGQIIALEISRPKRNTLAGKATPTCDTIILEAAECLRQHLPLFSEYYSAKYAQAFHHKHKRALVLIGRKALDLFVALLHHKENYRANEATVPSTTA